METNETRKGKYSKKNLKEIFFPKMKEPNKIYIKVKKKHFIFIKQNNNKNKKHIKIKYNKKVKSFYKNLKPGDFTVAESHGHPLVHLKVVKKS
jgi:hypothetical protein